MYSQAHITPVVYGFVKWHLRPFHPEPQEECGSLGSGILKRKTWEAWRLSVIRVRKGFHPKLRPLVLRGEAEGTKRIKAIKALKCNKAAGPDRIPAEMIKASSEPILNILLKTMNKIKSTFQYPEKWAVGITSLLFKDGDDEDPNNYRAITVTDILSKILSILINERLEKWSSKNNIIRKEQKECDLRETFFKEKFRSTKFNWR